MGNEKGSVAHDGRKITFQDGGFALVNTERGSLVLSQEDGEPLAAVALDSVATIELAEALLHAGHALMVRENQAAITEPPFDERWNTITWRCANCGTSVSKPDGVCPNGPGCLSS